MEVKGITPVAYSNPTRGRSSETARLTSGPRAIDAGGAAANGKLRSEVSGRLAESLLKESGVGAQDLAKYKVNLDIDGDTGRVIAEIRDRQSGDLVSEVPSRTLLKQAAMLQETLGTILDKPV